MGLASKGRAMNIEYGVIKKLLLFVYIFFLLNGGVATHGKDMWSKLPSMEKPSI